MRQRQPGAGACSVRCFATQPVKLTLLLCCRSSGSCRGTSGESRGPIAKGSPPHGILAFGSIAFFRVLLDPAKKNINRQRNKRECYKRVDHGFIHYFYRSS
ncbi:MAG: hypothetical protein DI595_19370 [Agrobacterium fabrum]|uniref:Uncharacterized protein n=1 Tax=Agrobacterium fabrum TaxID=1176649 RepID=A0A2W5GH53_9HYPH|nr:MAG: hypothetical protein DI595_19370 [Agrobacterium fabrum]